jgi:hypothetical protein
MKKKAVKKASPKPPRFNLAAQVKTLGVGSLLPPEKPKKQKDDLKALLYFVHERESIRLLKIEGMPLQQSNDGKVTVWTDDPILATYRFCNIRREDDRVSRWLKENVLKQEYIDLNLENFLLFSAFCRWVNWPPTIAAVIDAGLFPSRKPLDWKKIGKLVDTLGKNGKAWTGAYMIRAPGKGLKKGKFVAEVVVGKKLKAMLPKLTAFLTGDGGSPSYRGVWQLLQTVDGYGSFMAGQIAGDWTYTSLLRRASDLKFWAPMGPGSVRGFNRITGNLKLSKKPPEELWTKKLGEWRAAIVKKMGGNYEDMTALDVQNICCEVDKYLRVKNGEGRPRAKYSPHTY